jgi:hypothetical protein
MVMALAFPQDFIDAIMRFCDMPQTAGLDADSLRQDLLAAA